MKTPLHYLLILLAFVACSTSKLSRNDEVISEVNLTGNKTIRNFYRHGLLYAETIVGNSIQSRYVYLEKKLIYRYPISRGNLEISELKLESGRNFLRVGEIDTILISNKELPIMNRAVHTTGAALSRISDSSYLILATEKPGASAKVFITVSANYEEINNTESFISDSLILSIK